MRSLAKNSNYNQIASVSRFPAPVIVPKFEYFQDKWSTCRTLNVETIAQEWQAKPHLIRVFSDKKLGSNSVVMLKKSVFEDLSKQLLDIQNGEIVLQSNLEALFDQVDLVTSLFEQTSPQSQTETMTIAIRSLKRVSGQIQSTLHYTMPPKKVETAPLSEEELKLAQELDADE